MPRRSQLAASGAFAAVAAAVLVYLAAVHVVHGLDATVLNGFANLDGPTVGPVASLVARLVDPQPFTWLTAAVVATALVRRRPRSALAVLVVTGGANVTTQLLKPALATPRFSPLLEDVGQIAPASWPSGHATASMSLALCAIVVAPVGWRPALAALGAGFTVAVTFSFLTLGWHYPSDVLGGFLVATAWTLAVIAALWWAQVRWPTPEAGGRRPALGEALAPVAVAAGCAALLAAALLLARPAQVVAYAHAHTTFVVGAGLLAAAALALAAAVSVLLVRAPR